MTTQPAATRHPQPRSLAMQPTTQTSATPTPRLAAIVALTLAWMGLAAQAATWNVDDNGFWSGSSNWDGGVPNAIGATAALDRTGGISADRIVTLDQNATVGTLTMNDSDAAKNSWTIAQGDAFSLTLDAAGAGPATMTVSQGTANAINVPVTVTDPLTLSVATGTKLTLGGNLSGTGKITTLTPGTVRLEGNNSSFSGGIHVNDSSATKFEILTATALGTGTVTFGNSANGPVFTNVSGGALTIDTPIGTQNHSTSPRFAGNDMTFTNFRLSSSTTVNHVFYIDGTTTLTLPNGIGSGSGSRKAGTGNLTITGASGGGLMGWEGGGTLRLGHDQALGSGSTTFRAYLGTYIPTGGDRIVANQVTFGAPGQNLTFDLSSGNDLTFNHASPIISHDFDITVTGPGVLTISGNATSTMRPDKRGSGTLILSGNNSGATSSTTAGMRLHAGTLGLGHDNALGPSTNRLDVRGGTLMAVGGTRTLANPIVFGTTSTLTVDTDYPIIFNGLISVPNTSTFGTLVVNRGTLRINGDNTGWNSASAKTVNNGGMLIVGHANALGTHASSVITVKDGGTFGVATTFSRSVTFDAGSSLVGTGTLQRGGAWTLPANFTLAPGFSTGMLTINVGAGNTLAMNGTTTTEIEIADLDDHDLLAITGNATLAGNLEIILLGDYRPVFGTTFDVITSTGTLSGMVTLSGPEAIWFSAAIVGGNTLQLTSLIPEPSSAVLLALAGLALARRRRQRG